MSREELERMIAAEELDRATYALTKADLAPLARYVESGVLPGDFLQAVLRNDLGEAAGRADLYNRRRLFEYVQWLYNEAPGTSWGSEVDVKYWVGRKTNGTP